MKNLANLVANQQKSQLRNNNLKRSIFSTKVNLESDAREAKRIKKTIFLFS